MSRIGHVFAELKKNGCKALIPYVTAGDPQQSFTVGLMHEMVAGGADVIELGVPFSDPMADGPVITLAHERALRAGTRLLDVLAMVAEFRQQNTTTPVVLMGYLNPVERMGYQQFVERASTAGVDGVLLVDLPPEEAGEIKPLFTQYGLDLVFLLAPTTPEDRIRTICEAGSGYVYYVSLRGVTGAANLDITEVRQRVETIRLISHLPIGVGFGIKDAESAAAVGRVSDGVVVGSALVRLIEQHAAAPALASVAIRELLTSMRRALDA